MSFAKRKRNFYIWFRKKTEVTHLPLEPQEIEKLRFYQFKATTAKFFYSRLNKTDIRVTDTPHYQLALALAENNPEKIAEAEQYYRDYIACSWQTNDNDKISKRIDEFREHFQLFRDKKIPQDAPVLSQLSQSGDLFVVDGNHRTSFSAALKRQLKCEKWPLDLAFLNFSYSSRFYGSGHRNMPYQSVYLHFENVLQGRRDDVIKRLKMIPAEALQGATILDVASNFGMSSIIAKHMGANSCLGIEQAPDIVDYANRFAMFNGVYPDVEFRAFDLDKDQLEQNFKATTAFMFSIHDHLKHPEKLIDIARDHVSKYVIFEGHPHGLRENYAAFFGSGLFKDIREIGRLSFSAHDEREAAGRILWICEKN